MRALSVISPAGVRAGLARKRRGVAHPITCWAAALIGVFHASVASAINPDVDLTQLGHIAWRVQDGVLPGPPTAIAQTNDGYIWIGTHAGLVRFDGAAFVPVAPSRVQTPLFTRITALHGAKDGSLWVGTSSQLGRWKEGQFHLYEGATGFFADIAEGSDGTIWTARQHTSGDDLGPLCEVRESKLSCHGSKEGIPFAEGIALTFDATGSLWIAGTSQLARWQGGHAQVFAPSQLSRSEGLEGFKSIIAAPDGSIWSGVVRGGPGLGLQHFTNGTWKPEVRGNMDTSDLQVNALLFDRDGGLWIGTASHGIYRIGKSRIDHFGVSDGLSADSVIALTEDRESNVWAITTMGVDKFRTLQVVTISSRQGLSADEADAVLTSKSGAVWVSNATALDKIERGTVTSYSERDGFPGQAPTALFEDSQERLWMGVDDGVAVLENGRFTRVAAAKGSVNAVLQFAQGPDSTVWAVTATLPSRLIRMNGAGVLESLSPPAGYRFSSFASDPDGGLWISAYRGRQTCDLIRYANRRLDVIPLTVSDRACRDLMLLDEQTVLILGMQGIVMWRDGVARKLGVENGLPCGNTYGSVLDGHGNLWLSMQCGLASVKAEDLMDWFKEPTKKLQFRLFDTTDGVLPGSAEFHPRAAVGSDGRVWFANASVVQFLDPQRWLRNSVLPPVHIQALVGDGHTYNLGSPISVPPLTRDVQINFTAPSFVVPQRVQFRYRLEEWDKDWVQPVGRRQALYSNLPPGRYRFSVIASNDEGMWNNIGDSLEFRIPPAYYQTGWFRTLCAFLFVAALAALYRTRVAQVRSETRRLLQARLSERERIARELHDTLLQGVQGLIWRLQGTANRIPPEQPARQEMQQSLDQADQLLAESRDRVKDLRPDATDMADLAQALATEAEGLAAHHSAKFRVIVQGDRRDLHPIVREEAFQIGREALRNAFRHAGAKNIEVELTYEEAVLHFRIRDDGRGIGGPVLEAGGSSGHFGLVGMKERAKKLGGHLEIWSKPEAGTEIALRVPAHVAYMRLGRPARLRSLFAMFRRRAQPL